MIEGVDDITGEPLVQRDDDKPECVRNRLSAYDQVSSGRTVYWGGLTIDARMSIHSFLKS